jgi:NAD-specific glutamate dehydrogenase
MRTKNLNGFYPNLSRAYEIALTGGYSIQVIFDKEYLTGFDDYALIKAYYKDIEFSANGQIIVEIFKPDYNQKIDNYETISDIKKRSDAAKGRQCKLTFASNSCEYLLKMATDRLNISLSERELIIEMAGTIAKLDGKDTIHVEHLAESIQYRAINGHNGCNAENKTINFGCGISISLHSLETQHINEAIEYLKKL